MKMIKDAMIEDMECQLIIKYIREGWPLNKYEVDERVRHLWSYKDGFEYVNGIIFQDNLVYITRSVRAEMLSRVHDGHMGIDRCKRHAREVMFWPSMARDVEGMVRRCGACAARRSRPPREPLVPHAIPDIPWLKVGSDIFQHAGKYYLIMVDYFSNFIEVNPLTNIGTKAVVAAMKDQFARHGIVRELITDNGPAYASKEFADFSKRWGFQHTTTSPNYPQSNGLSERSVQTVKNILIKSIASGSDFYLGLLNYRVTPRDRVSSPAELLMGRKLNTRLPAHIDKLKPSRNNDADYANMMKKQHEVKERYDRQSRSLSVLQPGQPVLMADVGKRKFARIEERAVQPRSYFVSDSSGRRFRRNRRHLIKLDTTDANEHEGPSRQNSGEDELWQSPNEEDDEDIVTSNDDVTNVGKEKSPDRAPEAPDVPAQQSRRPAALEARRRLDKIFKIHK